MEKNKQKEELKPETEQTTPGAIMSTDERRELLSRIARGEIIVVKPAGINKTTLQSESQPDFTARKNAIAELNKMDGIYTRQEPPQKEKVHIITPEHIQ